MTTMIRLFNLNSEHRYAQLEKKELGYDCARPFKGIEVTDENLAKYFKLHLERGISYLTGTNFIKNLDDLLNLAIEA